MKRAKKPFHTFKNAQGAEYKFHYKAPHRCHKANGICFPPWDKNPRIYVDGKLLPRKKLAVVIEEVFHSFFWDVPEAQARPFAARLAKLLYKSGWRKT